VENVQNISLHNNQIIYLLCTYTKLYYVSIIIDVEYFLIIIFENNKIGRTARLMTITKVKRTDDDKRKAANAANRRSRLKRRLQPEPIIVVIQNGEIKKNTRKTN